MAAWDRRWRARGQVASGADGVVGIDNIYAESATPDQLMEKYGLTAPYIVKAVKAVLKRKNHRG